MSVRLLLIDDEVAVRGSLRLFCEARGIEVVGEAGDGQEGLALATELRPDCVLVDMRMPIMDGLEATRLIKAELPDVVVVVLSGYNDESLRREAVEAGAAGWFLKGESARELCDHLMDLVPTTRPASAQ